MLLEGRCAKRRSFFDRCQPRCAKRRVRCDRCQSRCAQCECRCAQRESRCAQRESRCAQREGRCAQRESRCAQREGRCGRWPSGVPAGDRPRLRAGSPLSGGGEGSAAQGGSGASDAPGTVKNFGSSRCGGAKAPPHPCSGYAGCRRSPVQVPARRLSACFRKVAPQAMKAVSSSPGRTERILTSILPYAPVY